MNNNALFIALALFFVLFFPLNPDFISLTGDIFHSLFWRLPAIILVLLLGKELSEKCDVKKPPAVSAAFRPARDFSVLGIALPVLCLLGFLASFCADRTGFPVPALIRPSGAAAWVAVVLACLTTGYLEEAYFRVFLPVHCAVLGKWGGFWLPVLLFSFCHIYEGPWGFINALLAAVMLSLVYKKTSSLHGIALAHGLYNMAAYVFDYAH